MNAVSARVLDAAIEWQLCLDSGSVSAEQQACIRRMVGSVEHARVWQQLNGLDIRLASGPQQPARRTCCHSARSTRRRRLAGSALGLLLSSALLLGLLGQQRHSTLLPGRCPHRPG